MPGTGYLIWNIAEYSDDCPCVRDDEVALDYRQFAARTDAVAARFAERGVRAGDVVAVALPNGVRLLVAIMASWRLGAAVTTIDPGLSEFEAEYRIRDCGAVLVVNEGPGAPSCGRPVIHAGELTDEPVAGWSAGPDPRPADPALIAYPPGATGRPKGVRLSHANLDAAARTMRRHLRLAPPDHCLQLLPLCHVDALVAGFLAPLTAGARLSITARFGPARFFDDIARLRATYFCATPATFARLACRPVDAAKDLSSLRFAMATSGPLPEELRERVERRFAMPIVENYGPAEASGVCASHPLDGPRTPGTVGPALPGQRIAVVDEQGRPVPTGTVGEVVVAGPAVATGYHGRPEDTAHALIGGGMRTGDLGRLDEGGALTLVGRLEDVVLRGGGQLFPLEIEHVLAAHPDVLECAVIGAPDSEEGEVPVAYTVLCPGEVADTAELLEFLADRLPAAAVPTEIRVVEALPRTAIGGVDRAALRRADPSSAAM